MKKIWLIIVILILIILAVILFGRTETTPTEETFLSENEEVAPAVATETVVSEESGMLEAEQAIKGQEALESAKTLALNMNQVSEEGVVLTTSGLPADNSALPGSFEAPYQSMALKENEIPYGAMKLNVSDKGFEPKEINAEAGKATIISLTATDNVHILRFEDASLQGIRIIVSPEETRAIVFNAPKAGDYVFYCEMEGHREAGETGVMRVK